MELHRILARDHRSALDEATVRFGKDVLIVSTQTVNGMTELVVALDPVSQASAPRANSPKSEASDDFAQAFRKALDPQPTKSVVSQARVVPSSVKLEPNVKAQAQAPQGPQGADWDSLQDVLQQVRKAAAPETSTAPSESRDTGRAQELVDLVRSELAALRQEVSLTRQMQMWPQQSSVPVGLEPLVQAMHELAIPAALRTLLVDGLRHVQNIPQGFVQIREQLLAGLEGSRQAPNLMQGIHLLCGPTGAGKSHMAVRLARAATQLHPADQVAIVAFDDQRCGAWSQLQVLSAQAGVACYRARDLSTLRLLLDELSSHGLVIIDTAGAEGLRQVEAVKALQSSVQCHVVLPADASPGTLRRWMQPPQKWDGLVISKLDESEHPWALIQHLCDAHTPVAAMSQSQDPQAAVPSLDLLNLIECGMQRLRSECEIHSPTPILSSAGLRPHLSVVASA